MDGAGGGGLTDGSDLSRNVNTLEGEDEVCTARRAGQCAFSEGCKRV